MKKSAIILFILAVVCLCLVGCVTKGGEGSENHASGGESGGAGATLSNDLKTIGAVGDRVVINPAFTWQNNNGDETFTLTVKSGDSVVFEKQVSSTAVSVDVDLDGDAEYKAVLKGDSSGSVDEVTFKTMNKPSELQLIKLDDPISSDMVLQRDREIVLSGKVTANTLMTVNFGDETYYAVADETGAFSVTIPAHPASFTPTNIVFTGESRNTLTVSNVLVGDVYLFAGQSNMQWQTVFSDYEPDDVTKAIDSDVRFFAQDVVSSSTKLDHVKNGRWFAVDDNKFKQFSAIAFMTGSMLSDAMKSEVPIGIVTAYQGDTNIANWMGPEYYTGKTATKYLHFNAMIYPLRHTKLTGVVWYQGCNNSGAGGDYKDYLKALFSNYRDLFDSPKAPFYVIGLCCYDGDSGNNYDFSYVREAQAKACAEDEDAYFISTCDNGDPSYIHPRVKRYICERVSKCVQATVYKKNYLTGGPTYKSHTVKGGKVVIEFDNADGLYSSDEITGLYLAGSDGKCYEARGRLVGETLEASCAKVADPVYVKYGFGKSPFVNIYNKDGYAITPFRTDEYNTDIDLLEYNGVDAYKFHPDGSQMNVSYDEGDLKIIKANDGRSYGSVRLEKWGMISYDAQGFRFGIKGTNSGAKISFRVIEGSYEIWSYKVVDDFVGDKTFTASISEFDVVYNKADGVMDTQKVQYIEVMIEAPARAEVVITEARFIKMEETAPMAFAVSTVSEEDDAVRISTSKSVFARSYTLTVSTRGDESGETVYTETRADNVFAVPKDKFTIGVPYYVFVTAANDLGTAKATNDGYVFYLRADDNVVVCNFDFADQSAFAAYMQSSMSVHAGLSATLDGGGAKITSAGQGWQYFIFKFEAGTAKGMTKLKFTADFGNYKGRVVLQLADTSFNNYTYNLDITSAPNGTYVIDFESFKFGNTPFTTQTLVWVMFNFDDSAGDGYILLDDVQLLK